MKAFLKTLFFDDDALWIFDIDDDISFDADPLAFIAPDELFSFGNYDHLLSFCILCIVPYGCLVERPAANAPMRFIVAFVETRRYNICILMSMLLLLGGMGR